jgi:Zn-dependent protease with chaperone function
MRLVVYLPFVVSALLGLAIPHFGRLLRPATATRLLVAAGATCAMTSAFALAILAWTYIGQFPLVAALGDWSVRLLKARDPVPPQAAQIALLALGAAATMAARAAFRHVAALVRAARTCRELRGGSAGMVVVDDPAPRACAVPGPPGDQGRIVVSSGLLRALDPDERRVVLAHEGAHLRDRHHLYRAAAAVAAALNPLLVALPRTVEYTTERWADERAAEGVGDRRLAARAIIRAALITTRYAKRPSTAELGFDHADVPSRINCLLAAPPRRRPLASALLLAALVLCLVAANDARADTEKLFESSEPPEPAASLSPHAATIAPQEGQAPRDGGPAGAGDSRVRGRAGR